MSKKNKHRHQQRSQHAAVPEALAASAIGVQAGVAIAPPQTPESAVQLIKSVNAAAIGAATDADLELAMSTTAPIDAANVDILAAAKQVSEILTLCAAREERCAQRELAVSERERQLLTRNEELTLRSDEIQKANAAIEPERTRFKAVEEALKSREHELEERERGLRDRELNAEAGFAGERRESLRQLDQEAGILRDELSQVRARIATERATWERDRRVDDEHRREEEFQSRSAQADAIAALDRDAEDRMRIEREQLAQDRLELKRRAAQVQVELEILREDRVALDERVARKASNELETAKARQQDLKDRLASAQKERDELYDTLRLRDEAERVLGNRPLPEVKREMDELRRHRDSLLRQLAERPNQDVAERLAGLERAQEEWESDRSRLTQEAMAAKTALSGPEQN